MAPLVLRLPCGTKAYVNCADLALSVLSRCLVGATPASAKFPPSPTTLDPQFDKISTVPLGPIQPRPVQIRIDELLHQESCASADTQSANIPGNVCGPVDDNSAEHNRDAESEVTPGYMVGSDDAFDNSAESVDSPLAPPVTDCESSPRCMASEAAKSNEGYDTPKEASNVKSVVSAATGVCGSASKALEFAVGNGELCDALECAVASAQEAQLGEDVMKSCGRCGLAVIPGYYEGAFCTECEDYIDLCRMEADEG